MPVPAICMCGRECGATTLGWPYRESVRYLTRPGESRAMTLQYCKLRCASRRASGINMRERTRVDDDTNGPASCHKQDLISFGSLTRQQSRTTIFEDHVCQV